LVIGCRVTMKMVGGDMDVKNRRVGCV
jgi:hypothetical protein